MKMTKGDAYEKKATLIQNALSFYGPPFTWGLGKGGYRCDMPQTIRCDWFFTYQSLVHGNPVHGPVTKCGRQGCFLEFRIRG
jgi:hypothetical protein